jgi:hypothetical protein
MNNIDKNIPAFPTAPTDMKCGTFGMTLRDWFAGMAMSGILGSDLDATTVSETVATIAYHQADAMLAARKPAVAEPEWIEWNGGNCPIEKGTMIQAEFRNGARTEMHPCSGIDTEWKHYKLYSDIIAYRIGGKP